MHRFARYKWLQLSISEAEGSGARSFTARVRPGRRVDFRCLAGNAKRLEAALKAGADANAVDEVLGSALGGASYSGNLEAVRLLTDRGANVNAKDNKGLTPLMNATLSGNADVVRFLIGKGADVNAGSPSVVDGRKITTTALLLAKGSRHNQIVTLLVEAGAKE